MFILLVCLWMQGVPLDSTFRSRKLLLEALATVVAAEAEVDLGEEAIGAAALLEDVARAARNMLSMMLELYGVRVLHSQDSLIDRQMEQRDDRRTAGRWTDRLAGSGANRRRHLCGASAERRHAG
jgi:hypothetical protein